MYELIESLRGVGAAGLLGAERFEQTTAASLLIMAAIARSPIATSGRGAGAEPPV
jgi:hypothetical protein